MVLVAGLAIGVVHEGRISTGPASDLAAEGAFVTVDLTTRTDPLRKEAAGPRPAYVMLRARLTAVTGRGQSWRVRTPVLVTISGDQADAWTRVRVGTRIQTSARLQAAQPGSDVAAVVRVRGPTVALAPPPVGLRLVDRVREGLRTSVAHRRDEQRALVPALVLGDTSAVTPGIADDFRATGLTHLTAVSGANLTLLLAFMLVVARWVGVRGWWLHAVGLAGVVVFVALCRTEPSVLRAAAMGLVALAALSAGGTRKGLSNLCVAMLASGGIVWWARRWTTILRRWLPQVVAEAVAVPLAAHLATLPVVAAISGTVSVIGIVTNALAGPFVGPATVSGFAAAGLSVLSPGAATVAAFGAAWSAQMILWVAHLGARFPGASWPWPTTPVAIGVLGLACLAFALVLPGVLRHRLLAVLVAAVMVVGFVRGPAQPGWPARDWVMVACDVGQGDGLVVRVGDHQAVVVDVGPEPEPIRRCLDQLDIKEVPVLVLTHFHTDHVNGLIGVLDRRSVGEIWVSPLASPVAVAQEVKAVAAARGVTMRTPGVGEQGAVGRARFQVIGPVRAREPEPGSGQAGFEESATGESGAENDASLVMIMTVDGVRLLLTGDVEPAGQQAVLATGVDLRVDVLKLPHHGSSRQDPAFVAASHARVAVASAGLDNSYGHPAPRTLQLVTSLGMTVLRTDRDGAVAITSHADRLAAVVQRG